MPGRGSWRYPAPHPHRSRNRPLRALLRGVSRSRRINRQNTASTRLKSDCTGCACFVSYARTLRLNPPTEIIVCPRQVVKYPGDCRTLLTLAKTHTNSRRFSDQSTVAGHRSSRSLASGRCDRITQTIKDKVGNFT